MAETVTVPKALLKDVLETAESDSYSTQEEFAWNDEMRAEYKAAREKIRTLRIAAGLPVETEAVGQGFFGLVAALEEKNK